jgi:hypothetical protein
MEAVMLTHAYIEIVKNDIADKKATLERFESGNMRVKELRPGEPWADRTQAWADDLKRTIALFQSVVDDREAAIQKTPFERWP